LPYSSGLIRLRSRCPKASGPFLLPSITVSPGAHLSLDNEPLLIIALHLGRKLAHSQRLTFDGSTQPYSERRESTLGLPSLALLIRDAMLYHDKCIADLREASDHDRLPKVSKDAQ
jgi:hypothetical protein